MSLLSTTRAFSGLHPEPPLHEAVRQLAADVAAAQQHAPEDRVDPVEVDQRRRVRPAVAMEEAGLREGEHRRRAHHGDGAADGLVRAEEAPPAESRAAISFCNVNTHNEIELGYSRNFRSNGLEMLYGKFPINFTQR